MSPPLLRILRDLTEEFQRSKPLEIPVYILRAAVKCGQNRKSQCKMRQRSSRSERRKMALPSVARRIKDTGRTASELVRKLVSALIFCKKANRLSHRFFLFYGIKIWLKWLQGK